MKLIFKTGATTNENQIAAHTLQPKYEQQTTLQKNLPRITARPTAEQDASVPARRKISKTARQWRKENQQTNKTVNNVRYEEI
jgi:hypothetical protein